MIGLQIMLLAIVIIFLVVILARDSHLRKEIDAAKKSVSKRTRGKSNE